ncbi:hypothetical protein DVH05_020095 [Phytophthora capsici]|nr:hypothetical protein DVH05_020095 [Phytophthora capsici]
MSQLTLARDRLVHDDEIQFEYIQTLHNAVAGPSTAAARPIEKWTSLFDRIKETAEATIGYRTLSPRQMRYKDPVLEDLSSRQRDLQIRIYNDVKANTYTLRRESNAILQQIQFRYRDLATKVIDEKIKRIEDLSPTAQVHEAVRDVTRTDTVTRHQR